MVQDDKTSIDERKERFEGISDIINRMNKGSLNFNNVKAELEKIDLTKDDYKDFLRDRNIVEKYTTFEKICVFFNKFAKLKAPDSLRSKWKDDVFLSGMNVNEDQIYTALILATLSAFFLGLFLWITSITGILTLIFLTSFVAYNIYTYPSYYADVVRIKAGNETIKAIVYMAIYLSVNPVFIRALYFAASHMDGPIGRDFKKILWDLEVKGGLSIEDIIGVYSRKWLLWNKEFVNSLNLLKDIEKQATTQDVMDTINEALTNIEQTTYESMKNYAESMRNPSSLIHSLGIMMPLFGMIMFPIVSIFMTEEIKISYVAFGYLALLPFLLWWYIHKLISRRPGAFSHSRSVDNIQPEKYIRFKGFILPLGMSMFLLGFVISLPAIFHFGSMISDYLILKAQYPSPEGFSEVWKNYSLSSYDPKRLMPSFFMALTGVIGPAVALSLYFYLRSYKQKEMEDYVKQIENQFRVGLFELSKGLKKGLPIETAIPSVLVTYRQLGMSKTEMYDFFYKVMERLSSMSTTIYEVLFNKKDGLLINFPSVLIKDIMNILLGAITKSTLIASSAMRNIVSYLKKLKEIEDLIRGMLSEIIASLNMQSRIIAPAISAVVATESAFIVQVLTQISKSLEKLEKLFNIGDTVLASATQATTGGLQLIKIQDVIPPTIMVLIVGIYLIEIVMIITLFSNGIENGFDEINRDYNMGKNIIISVIIFVVLSSLMLLFFQPIITKVGDFGV